MKPEDPAQPENHDHGQHEPSAVHYFVPGQVLLQLEHPAGLTQQDLAKALERFIYDNQSQEYPWKRQLLPPRAGKVLTFSLENISGPAFSVVPTQMVNQEAHQDEQVRLLVEIYRQLNERPVQITGGDAPPILLKAVSPNWLVGGVRHQIAIGSPGDWPDKASPPGGSWPEFHLPEDVELRAVEPGLGAGIQVAILDTAPCLHELDEAYDKWHGRGHPLIDSLLAPGGPLHIHPASYTDLRLVGDYGLLDHRYYMPDHGLFVAGIIHTLARQATLHLYEVLNPYGVGCVETIAQGVLNVLHNPDIQRPLIINCSLVLNLPSHAGEGELFPDFPAPLAETDILAHMRGPFEEIFNLLKQTDAVIVAAAGNDASRSAGSPTASRPPARFPAAFADVIGVGAVSPQRPSKGNRYQAASYSNIADDPADAGYVTLGGESGKGQGMLGLFTSRYPNPADKGHADPQAIGYLSNESGWARWAGTSFATPIVSGILAAWWDGSAASLMGSAASAARTILDKAVTGMTDQNEKVILVEQQ